MEFNVGDRVAICGEHEYFDFGTVINSYIMKEDQSYHGSPWYPEVTEVRTDTGHRFSTFDGMHVYFISIEKHRKYLEQKLKEIQRQIDMCLEEEKNG